MRVLKISLVLILANCFQISARSYAQNVTLEAKETSLDKICMEIHRQTGYNFFYKNDCISKAKKITINLQDTPLSDALDACLAGQPIAYKITGKTIVLTTKKVAIDQQPQKYILKGKVTDQSGNPIPGVAILIKGTQKGAATNIDGNYSIEITEKAVLMFRIIGYKTHEVTVSGKTVIDVVLEEEALELGETTFISTGYQQIKPEQSTGSLAIIKAKEFDTRVNTTDFLTGLQNKIPGLLINNDIQFEENSLFQIRGISTINGNKQPLIVMDGYPTELSIDMINPNEIESVTVLKDAAAATIYGARSSNGVIIIERKKAQIGKPVINFRTTLSLTPKENYNRYRWDKDASATLTEWEKINPTSLVTNQAWDLMPTQTGYSYSYNPAVNIIAHWKSSADPITTEERDRQLAELASYNNTKDYSRLFLRTASVQTYNLDISGGNESVRYYITTNYSDNALNQIKNNNNQFRLSGRTTIDLSKRFTLDLTTDFQTSENTSVPIPDIINIYPYERLEDAAGNPLAVYQGSVVNPYYNQFLMNNGLLDNLYYPLSEMDEVHDKIRTTSNRITVNFKYKLLDYLNLDFGGVYESSIAEDKHIASQKSAEARQYINRYTTGTTNKLVYNIPLGGLLKQLNRSMEGYTLRAQLNYNKQIAENHSVNLILGGELREIVVKSKFATYFGYDDLTLFTLPVDFKVIESFSPVYANYNPKLNFDALFKQKYENNRFVSAYSNIVYSYKRKYSLTGSFRIDQSNMFGTNPKYKYKPLWSVGAAWNIHHENFMEDVEFVNSMKLRVAYGFNGNVAKNAIPQVIAANGLNSVTPQEITQMLTLYSYANSGLRWEQTRNFNTGLDLKIFRNINLNIDYYIKKSIDILANNQIDATKGGSYALVNKASILNKGFEIDINSDWISRKQLNWNSGLIFSYNNSKVLEVYNANLNSRSTSRTYISGSYADYLENYAVGALFSLRYAGVDNEGHPLAYDKEGNAKRFFTKDEGVKELNYEGSSIPVFNAGFSNRVDVGNFYIYCMVHLYGGFKVRVPTPTVNNKIRPLEGASNYWKTAGDEADAGVLPFPANNNTPYLTDTDKYTVNGTYLTIGDLTASYSLRDSKLVEKTALSNLEVRLQTSNIYTVGFNKYKFSKATKSFDKSYITPTYTLGVYINF